MTKAKNIIESLNSLNEGGYSRLMQQMAGLVPAVKTLAIITWENPLGKKQSDKVNKKSNLEFKEMLRQGNHSFKQIKGRYDNFENPFVIFNISLREAKHYGFDYEDVKQDSIIYAKTFTDSGTKGIKFEMIYYDNRPPLERKIWTHKADGSKDNYSEYKGRKFQIPFFDDEFKNKKFKDGKTVVAEHNIFFAKDFTLDQLNNFNRERDLLLEENRTGRFRYEHRGYFMNTLQDRYEKLGYTWKFNV